MHRGVIESIDGGTVEYDATDEAEIDAMNADTFGDMDDGDEGPIGFFTDDRIIQFEKQKKAEQPPSAPVVHVSPPRVLLPPPPPPPPPPRNPIEELLRLGVSSRGPPSPVIPHPPPPGLAPARLDISTSLFESSTSRVSQRPSPPMSSIHTFPVRVYPTPFTKLQKQQALEGSLDLSKWGRQMYTVGPEFRSGLMTPWDKETVTKVQLNQMVALSGNNVQNFRGQFTFRQSEIIPESSSHLHTLGKKHYASVYHPRRLVDTGGVSESPSPLGSHHPAVRAIVEACFDAILDVADIDEYIATLHPLAEDKIAQALEERTCVLEQITEMLVASMGTNPKSQQAKQRAINLMVELLQPETSATEADARRSLIFRRAPQEIQARYVDMLERIVSSADRH